METMRNETTRRKIVPILCLLLAICVLPSCTGKVVEYRTGMTSTDGITVYPPILVTEEWIYTTLVDTNGNIKADYKGDSGTTCFPVPFEKAITRPDYDHPYRISYEHGFLEKYEFAVTLEEGMLKSVNVKSEADRGETAKNLASAAKDAASIAGVAIADTPTTPACTSGPKLVKIRRTPIS